MYLNPEKMTAHERDRIDRWLKANGAGKYIDRQPVIVHGKVAEFYEMREFHLDACRRAGRCSPRLTHRRLHLRIPLHKVA